MGIIRRYINLWVLLIIGLTVSAQEVELPVDFRQHNLTEYNSSLFSPVFSLDRNQPQSIALWSRWQWQIVDADPTTIFFNYTRRINPSMAGGLAIFQQNTGIFLNQGGVLNYAITTEVVPGLDFAAGLNLFGYQRQLADDRFQNNFNNGVPGLEETKDFILQLAPSVRFSYKFLSLGMVVENLLEYNFRSKENEANYNRNIFIGFLGSQIPVNLFAEGGSSYVQPTLYVKRIPGYDDQIGITTLFSTPKFWVQGGYNSFYGVSGGIGGRFFKNFSIGALIEYGTQSDLQEFDPTFEIVTAFNFGSQWNEQDDEIELEEEKIPVISEDKEDTTAKADSIASIEKQRKLEQERDSILAVQKTREEQLARERRQDSIAAVKKVEAQRIRAQRKQDSIRAEEEARKKTIAEQAPVKPRKGEKYEEVVNEEGIAPGYYLIANVFGTKRYYEAFMKSLKDRGLDPKSFYRASRKYNYVYLGKYNTMQEARQARDSQLNGRYKEDLWIFRMVARE